MPPAWMGFITKSFFLNYKMITTMNNHARSPGKVLAIISAVILLSPLGTWAQEDELSTYDRDTLISAAKALMETTKYCALITLDKSGQPQARTMDPFSPDLPDF